MDFLNTGISIGQYWGITVRLHFTFLIFALVRAFEYPHLGYGIAFVVGLYICILLHEFGHALAARWCDGEAEEILLWPLGGLAYCRPAFHPTAHLITTVAGPFVTLVLWLAFWGIEAVLENMAGIPWAVLWFVSTMKFWNLGLLLFNLLPAFPMDGGRIVRDTIWHWMSAETATAIAVRLSQAIALIAVCWAVLSLLNPEFLIPPPVDPFWMLILAFFVFSQCVNEKAVVGFEAGGNYQFSIVERFRRGRRQRTFQQAVRERLENDTDEAFHKCAVCGRTERDAPQLEFRVCTDCSNGQEYCVEHLEAHTHR